MRPIKVSTISYSNGDSLCMKRGLVVAGSEEFVVPFPEVKQLGAQIRGLQRLLGKKTMGAEILKNTQFSLELGREG